MTDSGFRRLDETTIHRGFVWNLGHATFSSPTGELFERDIVRSPGAVGVLPVVFDVEGNASVVLVSQYRPAHERVIIEIPAGMRDIEGEAVADVARRELVEEAGLHAGSLEHLVDILPSPGMTDSVTSIFLATGCTPAPTDRQGPEEEAMEIQLYPLDDALAMLDSGVIQDAKTVVALLIGARRLASADGA